MRWSSKLAGALAGLLVLSCSSRPFQAGDVSAFLVEEEGTRTLAVWASPDGVDKDEEIGCEVQSPSGLVWTFVAHPAVAGNQVWYGSSSLRLPMVEEGSYRLFLTRADGARIEQEFRLVPPRHQVPLGPFLVEGRVISWNDGKSLSWVAYDEAESIVERGVASTKLEAPQNAKHIVFAFYEAGTAQVERVDLP